MTDFEREDMELAEIMGGRFIDATQEPTENPAETPREKPVGEGKQKPVKNEPEKEKTVNNQWEPVKPAPNFTEKLKTAGRDVFFYGFLSGILFYWQQSGKLDYTTAWQALLVCVGMVFFSVGRHWGRK